MSYQLLTMAAISYCGIPVGKYVAEKVVYYVLNKSKDKLKSKMKTKKKMEDIEWEYVRDNSNSIYYVTSKKHISESWIALDTIHEEEYDSDKKSTIIFMENNENNDESTIKEQLNDFHRFISPSPGSTPVPAFEE